MKILAEKVIRYITGDDLHVKAMVVGEIVRCKDCEYYNSEERLCYDLMGFGRYWDSNDYCSYAERRTDG